VDDLTRLAIAARDGDRAALEVFVRRAQADVHRTCRYLVSRDQADDLTQETFLRALQALPAFRADSGARTWLLSIAQRTCIDHLRRRQRQTRLFDRLTNRRADGAVGSSPDHSSSIVLEAVLAQLDTDRRAAFVLTQIIGLPYDEAADVLGCPIGTIRSRVSRAREQLVRTMSDGDSAAAAGASPL
jgi:RNA polymerase sigma-70 factor (ECF subfamily)